MTDIAQPVTHPPEWWDRVLSLCGTFDDAVATERLADLILPHIAGRMLRREADLAVGKVVWYLNRRTSAQLGATAAKVTERLEALLERRRDSNRVDGVREALAICSLLRQRYGVAASEVESVVGMPKLLDAVFAALRSSQFDGAITIELLRRGQEPEDAVRIGLALGTYGWWPAWLRSVTTELALDGRLDSATITALDRCAFAELTPIQARMARKLIGGDDALASLAASRLASLGKPEAAEALLRGDLEAIAMASKLTLNVVDLSTRQ
jgi:hypothetical protein